MVFSTASGGLVIHELVQLNESFNERDKIVYNLKINSFIYSLSKMSNIVAKRSSG